jgi:hypothetical protein
MSVNQSEAEAIYVFRCNDSALYAFTADSSGQSLPSKIYPRVSWRLERRVTLHRDPNSQNDKVITATLKAIVEYGFYLTHAGSPLFSLADQNSMGIGRLNGQASDTCSSVPQHEMSSLKRPGVIERGPPTGRISAAVRNE